jgi:hypothetical protein
MQNEFDQRLKNMEQELLDIKTASIYSSVKSVETSASSQVRTGLYQITYDSGDTNIMALMFVGYGGVYPRTPQGDTQIIEIATAGPPVDPNTGEYTVYSTQLSVISNRKVLSIARIS